MPGRRGGGPSTAAAKVQYHACCAATRIALWWRSFTIRRVLLRMDIIVANSTRELAAVDSSSIRSSLVLLRSDVSGTCTAVSPYQVRPGINYLLVRWSRLVPYRQYTWQGST